MSEVVCVKMRLRDGSLPRVRAWAAELDARRDEALATLRDEDVTLEYYFLDRADDGDYLIGVLRGRDLGHAQEVFERSTHDIDAYHREFRAATWESRLQLEPLIRLERFEQS